MGVHDSGTINMDTRGSRNLCQRGSNSDVFFYFVFAFWLMREGEITLKVGYHRPTSKKPFKWHLAGGLIWPNTECWLGIAL